MSTQSSRALTYQASTRMSDDNYSGVLRRLGDDRRLVVNPAGTRYALQELAQADGRSFWAGTSYASLSNLLGKWGYEVSGLADACGDLPDDPAFASPDLQAARQSVLDAFAATDWRRDDYALVLFNSGSLRLIIATDGSEYRLQWLRIADLYSETDTNNWRTVKTSETAPPLVRFLETEVYDIEEGPFGTSESLNPVAPELQNFILSLPFRATDFIMPERLERPSTVW